MSQVSRQESSTPLEQPSPNLESASPRVSWLRAMWRFSRPHTVIGTTLSVLSVYTIAGAGSDRWLTAEGLTILVLTLVACLGGNIYIVGLNQLEDVEIDRVNKPHLPIASGDFTRRQGQIIIAIALGVALTLASLQGMYLLAMVGISVLLGTAYSLPPLRLKRFPFWASFCIFTVRGVVVNLGLFLHFNSKFQQFASIPATVWALTLFIIIFTFAIAIFKDIPDLEGDRRYQISTLTIRLGRSKVFEISRWVLTVCYLGMIAASFLLPAINALFIAVTHSLLLIIFWVRSSQTDLNDNRSIARCYQFIWLLFFLEYILFAIACLP